MSRQRHRKGHKILAYLLALVLLITAVPVAVSQASDYTLPTTFATQAAAYKTEWEEKGNDGKTTLFIGDSSMSPQIWRNFYELYEGKDVLRAGIGSSRTDDWQILATDYLSYTNPKNLVVHLGGNDIGGTSYSNGETKDAATTSADVIALLETLHATLPNTNIYYFGIKTRANTTAAATISETNALTKAWCDEQTWVEYADTSAVTADDLYDGIHVKMDSYYKMVDALAATGIEMEDVKKNMDIYLIAGQSNAAGWTTYDETTLSNMDSRYVTGFDNIYYSGTVATVGDLESTETSYEMQPVKAGLGTQTLDKSAMGPEVGMADALSSRYNSETGEYAGFIKYAVGAASLLKDSENDAHETWTSPTYMEELGTSVTDGTGMGVLYNNFLTEVRNRLAEYEAAGYNPIIKGMYWMQGEADRRREAEYIEAFEDFVSDVRTDLSTIAGQDLSGMPIMVGEISETFYAYKTTTLNANREFIAMQDMLPSLISDCYLIDNSEYAITAEDTDNPEPTDQNSEEYAAYQGKIVGSDNAHWNYTDCIAIGKQVGTQFQELATVETGDINADANVDQTDLGKLRHMLLRNVDNASQMITPDVYVSYDGGQVVNDADSTIGVGTYTLDAEKSSTAFVETTEVSYTAGRNGDKNGAIVTNHKSGPYTVISDYEFGKGDFTVSTWFSVPEGATLSTGGGNYIIGNDQPDGKIGFSATLKDGSLRFKVHTLSSRQLRQIEGTALGFTVNSNEWYNLVISREGRIISVYFDGTLLFTESIPEGYDFGTRDLGVGAYVGYGGTYQDSDMYFDDVQIYSTALTASEIASIVESEVLIPERNDVNVDDILNIKDLVDLKIAESEFEGVTSFDVEAPDAEVLYDGGVVNNTGTNTDITAGAYVLNAETNSTSFVAASSVQYGTGVDGTENGAILTNHLNGAYTVLDKVNLGTEDFAVSTWFNIPEEQTIGSGNKCYLLGTTKADDTTNGFRLTVRDVTDEGVRLAFKSGTNSQEFYTMENFTYGEWHHVAVSRIGNALFLYYDGELAEIQIIGEDFDFGDAKLAFGAYAGETWSYVDANTMYDDVRFYQEEVTVAHVREIYAYEGNTSEDEGGDNTGDNTGDDSGDSGEDTGEDTTETVSPKVKITFDGGTVENTGSDTSVTTDTYVLNGTSGFTATDSVTYTTGRDGSTNGAIITNHANGPYTILENCSLGTGDFTISTWINPEDASTIGNTSGCYLFGTVHPDSGLGFSVVLKKSSAGNYQIRYRGDEDGAKFSEDASGVLPTITSNTWYNVVLAKVGTTLNLYFDGVLVFTKDVSTYDFGSKQLAFGAYYGKTYYNDTNMYFDDIEVYGVGLSAEQIIELIMGIEPAKAKITFDGGTVANSGTDTSITANTYVLNGTSGFTETSSVTYATGRDGSTNGAIVTNHLNGPYAILENCSLGIGDFTISTWINPEDASTIGNTSGCYLFGTVHPESGLGFSVVLKKSSAGNYQIRYRGDEDGAKFSEDVSGVLPTITSNTWYNVVVAKVGTTLNIYFDGVLVFTQDVSTYDFGSKQLAFGAYYGKTYYNDTNMYFDDIEVYGVGLSAEQVQKLYMATK